MTSWQPIDTAPKDDKPIDLWVVTVKSNLFLRGGYARRVPDCRRCYDGGKWPDQWVDDNGRYVNFSRFYNKDDDWEDYLQPGNEPHSEAYLVVKATHWMPRPDAPPEPERHPEYWYGEPAKND